MITLPPACIDPQPGDRVRTDKGIRTVTARQGGTVYYDNQSGKHSECWITTWQNWCRTPLDVQSVPRD